MVEIWRDFISSLTSYLQLQGNSSGPLFMFHFAMYKIGTCVIVILLVLPTKVRILCLDSL
jgi:hypothetical protein